MKKKKNNSMKLEISFYDKITEEFTMKDIDRVMEQTKLNMVEEQSRKVGFKSLPTKVGFLQER